MSSSSLIVLLATVAMITAAPGRAQVKDTASKLGGSAGALVLKMNGLAADYICSLGGAKAKAECPGVRSIVAALNMEAPGAASDEAQEESLIGDGSSNLAGSGEDFAVMKELRKGLVDLICEFDTADNCAQFK